MSDEATSERATGAAGATEAASAGGAASATGSRTARPPKVVFEGVGKAFEQRGAALTALEDIDLSVGLGELCVILGPSGCGKSTLLHLAAGFERPSAGEVRIDGAPVRAPSPKRVFVFQELGVFPWATVAENVGLGLRGLPRAERRDRVARTIEQVGLRGFERAYPRELSGGMKQRVAVARALAVEPDALFLDEPFGSLDSLTRLQLRRWLLELWRARGVTVLFVTHDIDEAIQLAERVVVLTKRPGRIAEVVEVGLEHPRHSGDPDYQALRLRLHALLGVAEGV